MILDNCWRCKGTPIPEKMADGRFRVRCEGCGSLGLSSSDDRGAATLWNDAQRDERRILTDTELLQQPSAPTEDKFRDDAP